MSWSDKMTHWGVPTDHLIKSKYKEEPAKHGGQALLSDPYSIQQSMGFKERKYSLSYDMLKRVPLQVGIIASILQTRCNQIAAFSAPFRLSKSLGFEIKTKNTTSTTTKGQREMILSMEKFIYNCGFPSENPNDPNNLRRDDFDTFLRKIVRDTLTYDQATFEVIPTIKGTPYEFVAVDASTIRLSGDAKQRVIGDGWYDRDAAVNNPQLLGLPFNPYTALKYQNKDKPPAYVQVVNGQVVQVFTVDELAFGVRNPRTDLLIQGYGLSEVEQIVNTITAYLNAEDYNRRAFTQNQSPKGILNFKGDNMTPEMLEAFKRQWHANVTGVENTWRMPVLQAEQGLEFIDFHRSNSDMEYQKWVEHLVKIICGVFAIDPAEINFELGHGTQQTPLFETSSEWKLKASKDKGLKPLLRFIAKIINDNVISKIDDAFYFDFVGLDELTEQEKHELRTEQLSSYMTLNEVRRAQDLPDIEDGDTVLNPVYLQAKTTKMQMDAQKAQEKQQAAQQLGQNPGQDQAMSQEEEGVDEQPVEAPAYSDRFTKSVNNTKILEISLDDETWYDLV